MGDCVVRADGLSVWVAEGTVSIDAVSVKLECVCGAWVDPVRSGAADSSLPVVDDESPTPRGKARMAVAVAMIRAGGMVNEFVFLPGRPTKDLETTTSSGTSTSISCA